MHLSFQAINNLLYYQVDSTTSVNGFMLKDPTTYQGPYSGGEADLEEFDVSAAVYTPSTGQLVLTIGTHTLTTSDSVKVRPTLEFTCSDGDGLSTIILVLAILHLIVLVISVQPQVLRSINIGASPLVQYTPTGATYNPATGDMELPSAHSLEINDYVTIADDSLTFTCAMDSNASNHTYPRSSDLFW